MKKTFSYKRESKQNPYIGFTSFQHFRNDELYSDLIVRPENNMTETEHVECYPVPDYVEEKGRAQGYYPDCSVVYIRVLWKEFEPKQGEFNYALIDDILRLARENDQTLMFRLLPHSTRESDDVPDWLKELIECPPRPAGMREKAPPSDPKFLEYFGAAIKAFGERYDSDPTLAFMDFSLPGAWGEGSHIDLFTEEQIHKLVDVFTMNFPNTELIGQISSPWVVHYANKTKPVGWRADCIGRPNLIRVNVPDNVAKMPDVWKVGHISFEAYWWLGEWQRQGWGMQESMDATLGWHASTFNGKSLPIPWEWKDMVDDWVAKMGYHFAIEEVELPDNAKSGKACEVSFTVNNVGVAPLYHYLPLVLRVSKGEKVQDFVLDISMRNWLPGKHDEKATITLPDFGEGEYTFALGMGGKVNGKEYPVAVFATDAEQKDGFAILGSVKA